jgi:hypothetical protein
MMWSDLESFIANRSGLEVRGICRNRKFQSRLL